jgi:alpha-beta hydrolase superfamily lysophospholipase
VPWSSRIDTAEQVARLIEARVPWGQAHVVRLSLGGAIAHTLLARRPELLDRVVIDRCGALPAWWIGAMKLGVAVLSPFIHRAAVMGLLARSVGVPPGKEQFAADTRAAAPRAFRRAFADANNTRISAGEVAASRPTLLVAGEREPTAVRASNAALAALMPSAEAKFAPGLGHGWLAVAPEKQTKTDRPPRRGLPERSCSMWPRARLRRGGTQRAYRRSFHEPFHAGSLLVDVRVFSLVKHGAPGGVLVQDIGDRCLKTTATRLLSDR